MNDIYNLQRFVEAQRTEFEDARFELKKGSKMGHWMWFIFPQIKGLGSSQMAETFAISCREEAEEYLKHPVLGPRLIECTQLVNAVEGRSAKQIFGHPDYLKFRSSMTLFALVTSDNPIFQNALQKYFGGEHDQSTKERL